MKKAIRYSITVCLISWAAAAVARFGFGMDRVNTPMFFTTFSTFYMFLPMITALILQAIDKEKFNHTGLVNFKVSWPWIYKQTGQPGCHGIRRVPHRGGHPGDNK